MNIVYIHRFASIHRALVDGSFVRAEHWLQRKPQRTTLIVLEDDKVLPEIHAKAEYEVRGIAAALHAASVRYSNPLITTIDTFTEALLGRETSRNTTELLELGAMERWLKLGEMTKHISPQIIHDNLYNLVFKRVWDGAMPSQRTIYDIARKASVRLLEQKLLSNDEFDKMDAEMMLIPGSGHTLVGTTELPRGMNIVRYEPKKDKRQRNREGTLRPFKLSGSFNFGDLNLGSPRPRKVPQYRTAAVVNLEDLTGPDEIGYLKARFPSVPLDVPLDILAAQ